MADISFRLLRSSTEAKRPTAAQIADGELALNTDNGTGGIFYEDSSGAVVKVGPAELGGTAPNATPAGSAGNSVGEFWVDTSNGNHILKVYNGTSWVVVEGVASSAASATEVLFTGSSGALTGDANFTFDADNDVLSVTTMTGDLNGAVVFTAQADQNLTKGQVVYISGASGNTPTVDLARANSSSTMPAYGIVDADISSGSTGKIVTFGQIGNLDTATPNFSEGDTVYVSATSDGELVNTPPTGESNFIQNIGRVERVSSTVGRIVVGGAGRANATPNLNEGKIFIGNSSNEAVPQALPTAMANANNFGINAHASFDASAGAAFNWATDEIASGNIASVTRTAEGKFTITFNNGFSSANYTAVCTAGDEDHSGAGSSPRAVNVVSRSAGSMDIVVERTDDAVQDDDGYIAVMVIGTLA